MAEIGQDVPDGVSCFQAARGGTQCFGRQGAAVVRIADNDGKPVYNLPLLLTMPLSIAGIMIGFSQRMQTVSEGMALPGDEFFRAMINVQTSTTSERLIRMTFIYQESTSTAIVEPLTALTNLHFDAIFGSIDQFNGPIKLSFDLLAGMNSIPPLVTFIRNDFTPEDEECFTIRISANEVDGHRDTFTCNEDIGTNGYFCEHTICRADDDG